MSVDNRCGDMTMWEYDQILECGGQQINPVQQEISQLKRQILSMQLRIRQNDLEKLMEKVCRDENPTVKDAWDKYQSVLRLTSNK